jgi:polysaccharide export outer membrane protein
MKNIVTRIMDRWKAVGAVLVAVVLLTGCQSPSQEVGFADPSAPTTGNATPGTQDGSFDPGSSELLRPGDPIVVTFSDLPTITAPFEERIKEDGTITLLHNQPFTAAGKTRGELEREIRARYVPKLYVNLTVTVKPQENTRFYYVGGEVKLPNRQVWLTRLTVTKAIQSAGDFTDFAKRTKVQLTRVDGRIYTINVPKALKNPKLDLEVFPGDKIHVPKKIW